MYIQIQKYILIRDFGLQRRFQVLEKKKGSPAARFFQKLSDLDVRVKSSDLEITVKSSVLYLNYYVTNICHSLSHQRGIVLC